MPRRATSWWSSRRDSRAGAPAGAVTAPCQGPPLSASSPNWAAYRSISATPARALPAVARTLPGCFGIGTEHRTPIRASIAKWLVVG